MVIVIVRWYIKEGFEGKFKSIWIEEMAPKVKDGLFREFFSMPIEDTKEEKYRTLDVESKNYKTFINVGIWKDVDAFEEAIGTYILKRTPHPEKDTNPLKKDIQLMEIFDFEFKLRERIVMDVNEDRVGKWQLPPPTQ